MNTSLPLQVRHTIQRYHMFRPGDRVGVAVSGGADSVGLLLLLKGMRDELGISLYVLHLNHCLRGAESDKDERFVARLAEAHGLGFISERVDVAAEARRNKWNLEDAGRRLRYAFFGRLAEEGRVTRVAVAHTLDDQAETVLARILRGTAIRGLAAIHPIRGDVVRPLIESRRQPIRDCLTAAGQPWREDLTNLDTNRTRARLRHVLIPEIEKGFAPGIVERLGHLARTFYDEDAFWTKLIKERLQALVTDTGSEASIAVSELLAPLPFLREAAERGQTSKDEPDSASLSVARRIILAMFSRLTQGEGELSFRHIEEVLDLAIKSRSGHHITLPADTIVERRFDRLVFRRHAVAFVDGQESSFRGAGDTDGYEYVIELSNSSGTQVEISPLRTRLALKLIDWPEAQRETKVGLSVLDADAIQFPLVLRNWRPGDAYRPVGHRNKRKLKGLFLRHRVPLAERMSWPVLSSGAELVWVRNMPAAEGFSVSAATRRVLIIEERNL